MLISYNAFEMEFNDQEAVAFLIRILESVSLADKAGNFLTASSSNKNFCNQGKPIKYY